MSKPKVSVIIPVYNMEKYLRQALDSVINQTLKDIEIICVDDCSTDNSLKILEEYASKDERFVILKQEQNQGQGVARNRALDIAKSEYIMFLDPDDWYELNACELCYNQISKNKNDFVIFPHYAYNEETKETKIITNRIKPFLSEIDNPNINPHELKNNYLVNCYTVCQIYSKDFLNENNIRYSNHRMNEDIAFFVKVLLKAKNVSIIERPLYYYRKYNNSVSSNAENYKDIIDARKKAYELVKNSKNAKKIMPYFLYYVIRTSFNYFEKFCAVDANIEKEFYVNLRNFLKLINSEQKISKNIFQHEKYYSKFQKAITNNNSEYSIFKNISLKYSGLWTFIKKFFIKENKTKDVVKKQILGIKIKYANRDYYKNTVQILNFIEPYCEKSNKKLIADFEQKAKKKIPKISVLKQDKKKLQDVLKHFNPSVLPKATGVLRKVQLERLEFVKKIIADIEENTGLQPFMDDGTLLGAVRHKGFIPWDDDFDFSLMRKDYIKLEDYLRNKYVSIDTSEWTRNTYREHLEKTFSKYPNQTFVIKRDTSLKVFCGTYNKFNVCDFFALDYYNDYLDIDSLKNYVKKIKKIVIKGNKPFGKSFKVCDKEINENDYIVSESNSIQAGIDNYDFYFYSMKGFRRKEDIFPLKKLQFEDTEFWAPNNTHEYLKTLYSFYNRIPIDLVIGNHCIENTKVKTL